jgi:hypothetical protein
MAKDKEERVERLTGETVELHSHTYYRGGSNDYTKWGTAIRDVVDRTGRTLKTGFSSEWAELAPGIEARYDGGGVQLRIHRSACPVRVRYVSFNEYTSYTDSEHSSHSSSDYWVRYEA